ncbi:MAG: chromosome segregation protein SMC [Holophagales bacterium]|jgi:chromosome segregation protein|nr:chromosome segregation protein SMC [Holophagales bacterium]
MRLISLEIHGFKSFADPQKLVFPWGMTAVVGPNGCGKSNISDALAWVLGEQRASLLRGAEMADVVFAGTSERKPMGMAEVKLVLEMRDQSKPETLNEVTVSRRLFRDSGSEYRVNGRERRLKDVQDLLMDTGMGARGYSFIQQGQIDQILSTKPKDRRQLLEEAAGITRYKVRRAEAERRLDETKANLQRLDDILFEKSKQQDSLKRQAARTRRALELDRVIRDTQRILLTGKVMELEASKEGVVQNLDNLDGRIAQLTAQAAEKAQEVERQRLTLAELHRLQEQRIQQISAIDHKLGLLEQERGFQESRIEEAGEALNQINQRATGLNDRGGDWSSEIERLVKMKDEAQAALDAREDLVRETEEAVALAGGALRSVESELKTLRARQAEVAQAAIQHQKTRQSIYAQIAQLEGRLDTLNHEEAMRAPQLDGLMVESKRLSREIEGTEERFSEIEDAVLLQATVRNEAQDALQASERNYRETTGALEAEELRLNQLSDALKTAGGAAINEEAVKRLKKQGVTPKALTDVLKIDEKARPDLERVLGNWINAVALKTDWQTLKQLPGQLIVSIEQNNSLIVPVVPSPQTAGTASQAFQARPLIEYIRWQSRAPKVLEGLLNRVFRCRDDEFMDLATAHPELAFVSKSFVKLPYGPVQVGVEPPAASPLKMLAEREACNVARENLLNSLESLEAEKKSLALRASEAQERLREMEEDRANAKRSLEDKMGRWASVERQIKEIIEAQQRADAQWELHEGEISKLKARLKEIDEAHPEDAERALEAEIRGTESKQTEAQGRLEERRETLMEATRTRASAWSERDSVERQLQHLQRAAFDLEAEKKRLAAELTEAKERRTAAAGRVADIEREVQNLLDDRLNISKTQTDAQPETERASEVLRTQERAAREFQESLENARQLRQDFMVRAAEVHGKIEAVAKEVEFALGLSVPDFIASITKDEKEAWEQGELVHQTRLNELQSRRTDLGSVNPLAIQELEEVEAMLGFMNEQRADVLEAIANLETTIKEINLASEERFREAFDFINSRFQEVFRQVFGGGSAHLSLQDPKDLLECGIEITAQPPGKTAKVLTLLSGGEKALTAISLLFAIFHFKPSPFCVLDEVDAPLDEANVARFATLVKNMKEHTQFIVITHQKPTMIAADTLYGVTMEEKGISRLVSVQLKEAEKLTN